MPALLTGESGRSRCERSAEVAAAAGQADRASAYRSGGDPGPDDQPRDNERRAVVVWNCLLEPGSPGRGVGMMSDCGLARAGIEVRSWHGTTITAFPGGAVGGRRAAAGASAANGTAGCTQAWWAGSRLKPGGRRAAGRQVTG